MKKSDLEELGPGIWGREVPEEEMEVNPDLVRKLAEESGSKAFAEFLYRIFGINDS